MISFKKLTVAGSLVLLFSCQPQLDQPIEFTVSDGLLNNMKFSPLGAQEGDLLTDLTLFTLAGDQLPLTEIRKNTPLLIVTGSYTCDVTRKHLSGLQTISEQYKDQVNVILVNTLEAHPQNTQSPYSAEPEPWLSKDNVNQGIQAEQPRSMQERENLAEIWIKKEEIQVPVYLDGPKNEFWKNVGQAPNMAILIDTNGVILSKQAWFEEESMMQAIESQFE